MNLGSILELQKQIAALEHRIAELEAREGVRLQVCVDDVASPPTDAELDTAFGTPTEVGKGFLGLVNDSAAGTAVWLCASTQVGISPKWWYVALTAAV